MAKVMIKAKRTFAAGKEIFFPHAKKPYPVEEEQATVWEKAGYCEIVEVEEIDVTTKGDTTPQFEEVITSGSIVDYDSMEYNDLKAAAKDAGIKGYNTMKKPNLIAALKGE